MLGAANRVKPAGWGQLIEYFLPLASFSPSRDVRKGSGNENKI